MKSLRTGRGQLFEAEDKSPRPRTEFWPRGQFWPQGLNITGAMAMRANPVTIQSSASPNDRVELLAMV